MRIKKQPAEGGAVTEAPGASPDGVNPMVMKMTGHQSEAEMAAALPSNTVTLPTDDAPKRKRRTRAEMDAERGVAPGATASADPLMQDARYASAVQSMAGLGAFRVVKGGFKTAAVALKDEKIALDRTEEKAFDDYFYVVGKRANIDPSQSTLFLVLYFVVLMSEAIFTRFVDAKGEVLQDKLAKMFGFSDDEDEKDEKEKD